MAGRSCRARCSGSGRRQGMKQPTCEPFRRNCHSRLSQQLCFRPNATLASHPVEFRSAGSLAAGKCWACIDPNTFATHSLSHSPHSSLHFFMGGGPPGFFFICGGPPFFGGPFFAGGPFFGGPCTRTHNEMSEPAFCVRPCEHVESVSSVVWRVDDTNLWRSLLMREDDSRKQKQRQVRIRIRVRISAAELVAYLGGRAFGWSALRGSLRRALMP